MARSLIVASIVVAVFIALDLAVLVLSWAGLACLILGAAIAGYKLGPRGVLLATIPAVVLSITLGGNSGPIENSSTDFGVLILLAVAAPTVLAGGVGALARAKRLGRSSLSPSEPW